MDRELAGKIAREVLRIYEKTEYESDIMEILKAILKEQNFTFEEFMKTVNEMMKEDFGET